MTLLPDNRINLQPPLIDFPSSVGTTGQAHDEFPKPGPARYDWMRSFLIGLLSNQSSFTEPVEFRVGSLFFDLNNNSFKYRAETPGPIITTEGANFIDLANGISLETGLSLATWYQQVKEIISGVDPGLSSIFSKLTNATADETMSAGSLVYVSNNRRVKLTDQSLPTKSEPVGAITVSANVNEGTVIQHIGLIRLRMHPGLTMSAGDKVWMGSVGRGTTDEPGTGNIRQVGVVFDTSDYVSSASDPSTLVLLNLAGIDTSSPAPIVVPPMEFIAGATVGPGAVVYIDGAGKVQQALGTNISTSNTIVGIARNTATVGQTVFVDIFGALTAQADAGLISAGSPVYVSVTNAGRISGTQPSVSGQVAAVVGYANAGTTLPFQSVAITWAPRTPVVIP